LPDIFDADDKKMTRPPTLTRYAEKTKISPLFIGWPMSVGFDTFCRRHHRFREVERVLDLWPLGDMLLPLAAANLAFNSICVLAAPQNVWIVCHVYPAPAEQVSLLLISCTDGRVDSANSASRSKIGSPAPLDE
jgi:hypothetical protein